MPFSMGLRKTVTFTQASATNQWKHRKNRNCLEQPHCQLTLQTAMPLYVSRTCFFYQNGTSGHVGPCGLDATYDIEIVIWCCRIYL